MTTSVLSIAISGITPADQGAMAEAARRWDSIAKPIGGLGLLEAVSYTHLTLPTTGRV